MSTARTGPPAPPWWALLPPAQAEVSCGEQTHRLLWAEGRLTATDHPDAEGELVLAALGGDRSECVDLVGWWAARRDDLEVLAVGPRSAADELTVTPQSVAGYSQGGWLAYAPLTASPFPVHAVAPWAQRLPGGMAVYGALLRAFDPTMVMRRRAAMRATAAARRQLAAGGSPYAGTGAVSFARAGRVSSVRTGPMRPVTGRLSSVRTGPMLSSMAGRQQIRDEMQRAAARRGELFSLLALGPGSSCGCPPRWPRPGPTAAAARASATRPGPPWSPRWPGAWLPRRRRGWASTPDGPTSRCTKVRAGDD